MKKIKRNRGFYKELRQYYAAFKEIKKARRVAVIEYWLKHLHDSSKDIHFYAKWNSETDMQISLSYLSDAPDEFYEDHTLIRLLDAPRTRKDKTIHKSRLSSIPHIGDIHKAV